MVGFRADGKPDRRYVYGASRQEVAEKLSKLAAAAIDQTLPADSSMTVEQFLTRWFEDHKAFGGRDGGPLRANTVRNYTTQLRLHIIPAIGSVRLDKLTPQHLSAIYRQILEKGLSRRRAEMAHRLLHVALDAAVRQGLIPRNPADMVTDRPRSARDAKPPIITREQAQDILNAAKGSRAYIPLVIAFATGMRRGEVLGLRWQDLDLDRGLVHVRGQWQRDGYQALKTSSNERTVPLPPSVVEILRHHRASQKVVSLSGWVCTGRFADQPFSAQWLDHYFAKIRDQLGLDKRLTVHSIRRSYATWLAESGVDPKTIASLLGHSTIRTTLEIYQQVTGNMTQRAAESLSSMFGAR